jgi:hypothetical protein
MKHLEQLEQIVIEDTYSKKNIKNKVLQELIEMDNGGLGDKIDIACRAVQKYIRGTYYTSKNVRIDHLYEIDASIDDIVYEILIIVLQTKGYQTIQSVCGRLAGLLKYENIFDGIRTAGELITVACESDLYDIIRPRDSITGSALVEANYILSDELMQYIANTKYLPPMICEPNIIKNNWDCAYLTVHEPVMLKGNTHEGKLPLDVINIRNKIALSLDLNILELEELPKKALDTHEKKVNFARMKEASRTVYNDLVESGNVFHLTHRVDERLRMYTQGYHCSYQSSQYKKALIQLNKKELII